MDPKQRKRAQQEATQKASLIQKSRMSFFCTVLEEAQGDVAVTQEALDLINKIVSKPDGTVVRDVSSVGKLLLSANDDQLVLVTYVPESVSASINPKITAWSWMDLILNEYGAGGGRMKENSNETTAIGVIPNNPSKDVYVFKLKDQILNNEYDFLRTQGVLPPRANEDDETLLGDEVFDM